MKYRNKLVVIEAFKWTGDKTQVEDPIWIVDEIRKGTAIVKYPYLEIKTLEGIMKANVGDYIIKGISGEIYPCKPDIFELTYNKVNDNVRNSALIIDIKITDTDKFKSITNKLKDLIEQIEKAEFTDENGMRFKNNTCYIDLIKELTE